MVKHVKLFENWAEENTELPEYLNPKKKTISGQKTLFATQIINYIKSVDGKDLDLGHNNPHRPNFISFSDYNFWSNYYTSITINQYKRKYRLEDCFGIPKTDNLEIWHTYIKSLKGLESHEYTKFKIYYCFLENLKYSPTSNKYQVHGSPLLSYYGIKSNNVEHVTGTLCGQVCYHKHGYYMSETTTKDQILSPEFNANIFCCFPFERIHNEWSNSIVLNPWTQIYEDPNEVENYEFLFVPFYLNSENFRDKAKKYIKNLDAGNLDKSELW